MTAHPSAALVAATNWRSMVVAGMVLIQHDFLVGRMLSDLSNSASKPTTLRGKSSGTPIEPNKDFHIMSSINCYSSFSPPSV
jgi:hypothetical protein